MKKINILLLSALFVCFIVTGCDSGPKPIEITSLVDYKDELLKFEIKYPTNWITTKTPGERFMIFSSNDARSRFMKYDSKGFPGAMIDVYATKVDEAKTVDSLIKRSQIFSPDLYKETSISVDGVQGRRFDYGFELAGGEFKGVFIIASKDNITYTSLKIEAFDGAWATYEGNFNNIISSLKLAVTQEKKQQDTIVNTEEIPFPSANLIEQKGDGYSISIPDNFQTTRSPSQNVLYTKNYMGDRRGDCNILVDVLDASKASDFKKAASELAARYPGSPALSGTKLGAADAYMLTYTPMKDVKTRVYFAKSANKIFRVTMNWYVPEEKEYLPIFEKSVKSIKFN